MKPNATQLLIAKLQNKHRRPKVGRPTFPELTEAQYAERTAAMLRENAEKVAAAKLRAPGDRGTP